MKKVLKWIFIALGILIALGLLDLYTFQLVIEDPGYYVVAKHSESPAQVMDAIQRLRDDPSMTVDRWGLIVSRCGDMAKRTEDYSQKKIQLWKKAEETALKIKNQMQRRLDDSSPSR